MSGRKASAAALLVGAVLWSGVGHAQLNGSFDGSVSGPRVAVPLNASAAIVQLGKFVTGTLAIASVPADFAGIYTLTGKATPKRLKASGMSTTGAQLKWRAKIAGGTLTGAAKIKAPAGMLKGTLAMTLNTSTGDGSSCDGVYTGNTAFFTDHVLAQALATCTTCHVPGGQAAATRFHIVTGDPLATARSMALLVNAADPDSSRIIQKPLDLLPHGGGLQITPDSEEETILRQWVDLVANAHCS